MQRVHLLPPEFVYDQIGSLAEDLPVRAAKTGALGNGAIVEAVVRAARRFHLSSLVVDSVMVSQNGGLLL